MENENTVKYVGTVEEIIYYNEENGYVVFILETEDNHIFTCTGTVYEVYEGATLEVTGKFVKHNKYGKQLNVSSYKKIIVNNEESIIKYLSSGFFHGIGPKTAEKIVEKFGVDTFNIIENESEKLTQIKGITKTKASLFSVEFKLRRNMQDVVMKLQEYDVSINVATKIYEKYKDKSVHIIESNPYILIDDIEDINFKYADRIAERVGLDIDFHSRVEEGIRYVLKLYTNNGHVYMPMEKLYKNASYVLGISNYEAIEDGIYTLERDKKIVIEKERNDENLKNIENSNDEVYNVYLKEFYYAENKIVSKIKQMISLEDEDMKKHKSKLSKYEREVNEILDELEIELSNEQYDAVLEAIKRNVLLITGGPGTGKTTIIKVITKYFECNNKRVKLVAPTGRAAKRITETSKREAMTLHRLLEVTPGTIENNVQKFLRNEENPIEADVIIVDEMSMVDILLFNSLLKALDYGTKLILVGDEKQLPSVGPGNVLRDLVNSNVIKKISLTKIYRQASTSMIISNAHKIRNGLSLDLKEKANDFFFVECTTEEKAVSMIKELIGSRIPKFINCEKSEIQILTPVKRNVIGTQNLNQIIQEAINPALDFKDLHNEIKIGNRVFRVNDKVMQIKNDYEIEWKKVDKLGFESEKGKGIFNGDVGKITRIDTYADEIVVNFDDDKIVKYTAEMLKNVEHAYAITIHKSQGCEYKAVIIPILNVPDLMMYRNLLYTAVTRAKEILILVGSSREINKMILNGDEEQRYSNLSFKLKDEIKERSING